MAEELNVKEVEYPPRADQYISYTILPDLKRLGPRLGKRLPAVKAALAAANAAELFAQLEHGGQVTIPLPDGPVMLDSDDVQVRLQAKPGWAAAQGPAGVVVLSTELTPELLAEGTARELTHAIAGVRRDMDCQYTDRIKIGLVTDDVEVLAAVEQFADYIQAETLAASIELGPLDRRRAARPSRSGQPRFSFMSRWSASERRAPPAFVSSHAVRYGWPCSFPAEERRSKI